MIGDEDKEAPGIRQFKNTGEEILATTMLRLKATQVTETQKNAKLDVQTYQTYGS